MSVDGAVETWSRQISRPEDLPEDCSALLQGLFEAFPYCVRSPAIRSYRIAEPESFLLLDGSRMVMLKRRHTGVTLFQTELGSVDVLATETTLLHSCITFYPRDGGPESVHFNTVAESLFAPFVAAYLKTRGAEVPEAAQLRSIRPDPFLDLLKRDYKYHSYAFLFLARDEVKARFYHPANFVPSFRHWLRLIPSYLLVASGSMFYGFSEGNPFRSRNRADYSHLVRYIPVSSGINVGFRSINGENRYRMVLLQTGTTTFEIPLVSGAEADFALFTQALQPGADR
jgi:hypothetical protein